MKMRPNYADWWIIKPKSVSTKSPIIALFIYTGSGQIRTAVTSVWSCVLYVACGFLVLSILPIYYYNAMRWRWLSNSFCLSSIILHLAVVVSLVTLFRWNPFYMPKSQINCLWGVFTAWFHEATRWSHDYGEQTYSWTGHFVSVTPQIVYTLHGHNSDNSLPNS